MIQVNSRELGGFLERLFASVGLNCEHAAVMADIYVETTKRDYGHHDINNLPSRVQAIEAEKVNINPKFEKLAAFGAMEQWDGDNGLGEIINTFSMQRAIDLASEYGLGFCTVRNSNHYLCSAPYVMQAAKQGYLGLIIAKGVPTMGVPGCRGNVVGQSPLGYAFPSAEQWPVMLDICLAYASGEQLVQKAKQKEAVPQWWGVDSDGNPTNDAEAILKGTKFPIGGHKGFGLALLCELLTGVMSGGLILDENQEEEGMTARSTSHTALAIKADALMPMAEYKYRSSRLIERIKKRSPEVRIPGQRSWEKKQKFEEDNVIVLTEEIYTKLNEYGMKYGSGRL